MWRLDDIAVPDVRRFEAELLAHLRRSSQVLTTIRETGKFEEDTETTLKSEVDEFKKGFGSEGRDSVEAGREESTPLDDADVGQEQIVRQKRG